MTTLKVNHPFSSGKSDGPDGTKVRPTNWNADHDFTMSPGLVGRTAVGVGLATVLDEADYKNRKVISVDTIIYVRKDGDDANDGSTDDAAGAFLTIQAAINYVCSSLYISNCRLTIRVRTGTYDENLTLGPYQGLLQGDPGSFAIPAAVFLEFDGDVVLAPTTAPIWYAPINVQQSRWRVVFNTGMEIDLTAGGGASELFTAYNGSALAAYGILNVTGDVGYAYDAEYSSRIEVACETHFSGKVDQLAFAIYDAAVNIYGASYFAVDPEFSLGIAYANAESIVEVSGTPHGSLTIGSPSYAGQNSSVAIYNPGYLTGTDDFSVQYVNNKINGFEILYTVATPTDAKTPTGSWIVAKDTDSGEVAVFVNDAGVIRKIGVYGGVVTASTPMFDFEQEWNNGSVEFIGLRANFVKTAAHDDSKIFHLSVNGDPRISVRDSLTNFFSAGPGIFDPLPGFSVGTYDTGSGGTNLNVYLQQVSYNNDGYGDGFSTYYARGSYGAASDVQNGDILAYLFAAKGYFSGGWRQAGGARVEVDGAPSGTDVQGKYVFYVNKIGGSPFGEDIFAVDKDGIDLLTGSYRMPIVAVSALGSASPAGQRKMVNDANATTFASVVAGGGANTVPVYSDGSNWLIG